MAETKGPTRSRTNSDFYVPLSASSAVFGKNWLAGRSRGTLPAGDVLKARLILVLAEGKLAENSLWSRRLCGPILLKETGRQFIGRFVSDIEEPEFARGFLAPVKSDGG